jgi:hypothetical protein
MPRKTLRAALVGTTALTALAMVTPASAQLAPGFIADSGTSFNAISPGGSFIAGSIGTDPALFSVNLGNVTVSNATQILSNNGGAALAVNSNKDIVGFENNASGIPQAFFLKTGSLQFAPATLANISGGIGAKALGISAEGNPIDPIAVGFALNNTDQQFAVIWNIGGGDLRNDSGQTTYLAASGHSVSIQQHRKRS